MPSPLAMSPETERRFVELLLAERLASPERVTALAKERAQRLGRGERAPTLAHLVCDAGLVPREKAVLLLQRIRADRKSQRGTRRDLAPTGTLGPGSPLGPYRIKS